MTPTFDTLGMLHGCQRRCDDVCFNVCTFLIQLLPAPAALLDCCLLFAKIRIFHQVCVCLYLLATLLPPLHCCSLRLLSSLGCIPSAWVHFRFHCRCDYIRRYTRLCCSAMKEWIRIYDFVLTLPMGKFTHSKCWRSSQFSLGKWQLFFGVWKRV